MNTSEKAPSSPAPKFFVAGVDLGQKLDHSAVAVVDKRDKEFDLSSSSSSSWEQSMGQSSEISKPSTKIFTIFVG